MISAAWLDKETRATSVALIKKVFITGRSSRRLLDAKNAPRLRLQIDIVQRSRQSTSGEAVAAGAGEPKLNWTGGGLSAPGCAVKNGRCAKPNMPAIKLVGKLRTAML